MQGDGLPPKGNGASMNIVAWFSERSWRATPAKYVLRTALLALPFAWGVALVGVSFVGAFAFAATIVAFHIAAVVEPRAWAAEVEVGRRGTLNHWLSVGSSAAPFLLVAIAWMLVLL